MRFSRKKCDFCKKTKTINLKLLPTKKARKSLEKGSRKPRKRLGVVFGPEIA